MADVNITTSSAANKSAHRALTIGKGLIVVEGNTATTTYQCTADGSTDDRTVIQSAVAAAIADMPCVITFGSGDYAMAGGVVIEPAQGSSGLSIRGAGMNTTKLTMAKGAPLAAGEYLLFLIEPAITPEVGINTGTSATILTDADGAFTASALVGQYIHNASDPGSVGTITANTTTTITVTSLAGGSANTWTSGDEYRVSLSETDPYGSYLSDVTVRDIGFFDNDPATHNNGSEESHGIGIKYCTDAAILNCKCEDIGDEAFDMRDVIRGQIIGNQSINTPSEGSAGIACSVGLGCKSIVISNNVLHGSGAVGVQSTVSDATGIGVGVVGIAQAIDINDIVISNNTVADFIHGVFLNNADSTNNSDINNVNITGNVLRDCDYGVSKAGGQGNLNRVTIVGNAISNMDIHGINFNAGKTNTFDCVICDNNISDCADSAMKLQVTRANLSNNIIRTCPRGLHIFNGDDISISGGLFDNSGGSAVEEIEVETGTNIAVSGVLFTNSQSTSAAIKGVQDVHDCTIERTTNIFPENMIQWVTNCTGNSLTGGGIKAVVSGKTKICNNSVTYNDTGAANSVAGIILNTGNSNSVVTGNVVDMSGSTNNQPCVWLPVGADDCVVTGNNFLSKTAGSAAAINDLAAGTLKTIDVSDAQDTSVVLPLNVTT